MRGVSEVNLFLSVIMCTWVVCAGQWGQSCTLRAGVKDWLLKYEEYVKTPKDRYLYRQNTYNAITPKEKVRYLGKVLKCYVESLRAFRNRQVELIFLIDSSSSIGEENFIDELKFVKKLLADFTVDQNNTRVSVVTFSSRELVIRHIDHLSNPDDDHHKCSLLDGLHKIGKGYKGGGTYTLGALSQANVSSYFA